MTPSMHALGAQKTITGCKNGTFLPKGCKDTRITADAVAAGALRLDRSENVCSINLVVAVPPQWTETHSLIRYPSPYGRSCTLRCRPPFFRRSAAQENVRGCNSFDVTAGMALNRGTDKQKQTRGLDRCISNPDSCCPWLFWPGLRPVATPLANRRLSGAVPGRARRLSWAAMSPRGPLSARRVTWPIASSTKANADTYSVHALTGADNRSRTTGASSAPVVFFLPRPCVTPRG